MPRPTPGLLILDCDGALIDSEIISARMLVAELAKLGLGIDLAYVARHFLGRSYPTVMATIRREFGLDLRPRFEEDYREGLLSAFARELRIMPGVTGLLDRLAVPCCVATSSSPRRVEMSLRPASGTGWEPSPSPRARCHAASPRPTCSCMPRRGWRSRRGTAS